MLDALIEGARQLLTAEGLALAVTGTLIGSVVAILPGIGIIMTVALLLPLTIGMETAHALIFLIAIIGAAGFAGSITSILFNVPGDGINAATCLDGYPLARQGKAGIAIGASATASGLGALIGIGLLVLSIPFVRSLILVFGPAEFFALSVAGLALIAAVSQRAAMKSAAAAFIGMTLGLMGESLVTATPRFSFGVLELADGIPLVPALIGLFAIPELFELLHRPQTISRAGTVIQGGVWEGAREVIRRPGLLLRSSLIGTGIGLVPGVGASVASWVAYFSAMNRSKDKESFGKGNIEGVIAPEASIDAKEGGSLLPVLAFGVPASLTTALLLSAFLIHGVQPGQRLFQNDLPLVFAMILALVFTNVSTSLIGLGLGSQLLKLTLIPVSILAPFILVLGFVGAYGDQQSLLGILWALLFGALGIGLRRYRYPIPPLIVGLVLLPLVEEYFRLALLTNRGSLSFIFEPVPLLIFLATFAALVLPRLLSLRRGRRQKAREDARESGRPATVGSAVFALVLLAGVGTLLLEMTLLRASEYSERARLFPQIILPGLTLLLIVIAARELVRLHRRPTVASDVAHASDSSVRPDWLVLAIIVALPLMMLIFGIAAASGLYVTGFLYFGRSAAGWLSRVAWAVLAGVATSTSLIYVYEMVLGMRLS